MKNRGFTLLELLIVIGILAIISSVSILLINPGEYFKRGRDTQRIADINNLHLALMFYYTSGVANFDLDGPNYTGSCSVPGKVFISTPSGVAGPANLPSNWTYASSTSANLRKTDGSGWMPVNLDSVPAGSPLNTLPIDPVNDINQALYYTYVCATSSPAGYEFNANLESRRFNKGGDDDKTSKDGGDDPNMYEVGSRLTINPLAPVGYWAMDEGSGTTAGDSSKNGNNGTITGATWQTETSCKVGKCLGFNGSSHYVSISPPNPPFFVTELVWFKRSGTPTGNHHIMLMQGAQIEISIPDPGGQIRGGVTTTTMGRQVFNSGSGLIDGNWHFLGLTYNGASLISYIDSSQTSSNPVSGSLNTGETTDIGRLGINYYANGLIDEVRIYNRALTAAEILHYYNTSR